jgi:hypothetical protein
MTNEALNLVQSEKIYGLIWRTPKSRGEPTWGFTKV